MTDIPPKSIHKWIKHPEIEIFKPVQTPKSYDTNGLIYYETIKTRDFYHRSDSGRKV